MIDVIGMNVWYAATAVTFKRIFVEQREKLDHDLPLWVDDTASILWPLTLVVGGSYNAYMFFKKKLCQYVP